MVPSLPYDDEWQSYTFSRCGMTDLNVLVQRHCLRMIYDSCSCGLEWMG